MPFYLLDQRFTRFIEREKKALKRFDFLKYKLFSCKNSEVVLWISTPHQFVVPQLQVRNEERNIRKAINKNTEKNLCTKFIFVKKTDEEYFTKTKIFAIWVEIL